MPDPVIPSRDSEHLSITPPSLDFGIMSRGKSGRKELFLDSDSPLRIRSDRRWIRVRPSEVSAFPARVEVNLHSGSLKEGQRHEGHVLLSLGTREIQLPVAVLLSPERPYLWPIVIGILFTLFSFIPLAGVLGFFWLLWAFFIVPKSQRGLYKIFLIISSLAATFSAIIFLLFRLVFR